MEPEIKPIVALPTAELIKGRSKREGVRVTTVEPYQDMQIKVNGPAIVLVVTD